MMLFMIIAGEVGGNVQARGKCITDRPDPELFVDLSLLTV